LRSVVTHARFGPTKETSSIYGRVIPRQKQLLVAIAGFIVSPNSESWAFFPVVFESLSLIMQKNIYPHRIICIIFIFLEL
jgi:hypothetical protein